MKQSPVIMVSLCIALLTGIGCHMRGKKDLWHPIEPKGAPFVHVVQYPNETLEVIAKWYTGDSNNMECLASANPNINPDHLEVGNEIFLPDSLVKTKKSMPEKFISAFYQKKKKNVTPARAPKVSEKKSSERKETAPLPEGEIEDDFEVFGPK